MNKRWTVIGIVALILLASVGSMLGVFWWEAVNRLNAVESDLSAVHAQLVDMQNENVSLQTEIEALQDENEALQEKLDGTLPYSKADGTSITLQNNFDNVHNPTWKELKLFLENDETESITYDYSLFVCGDFAELLHNNAEATGIRAGVAIIHFEDDPIPHALNVFYSADYDKLVYIDCTGSVLTYSYNIYTGTTTVESTGEDKVAYVVEGKKYGLIPIICEADAYGGFVYTNWPTGYYIYETYAESWWNCYRMVEDYNLAVDEYNDRVDWYNDLSIDISCWSWDSDCIQLGTGEEVSASVFRSLSKAERAYLDKNGIEAFLAETLVPITRDGDSLERYRLQLEELEGQLGDYWYESLGVVSEIEIYW